MDVAQPRLRDRAWWAAYRAVYLGMRIWWRLRPLAHRGALVAIECDGKLLVIRNSYRRGWTFPGGGIESGETSHDAASRELREELGLSLAVDGTPTVISGDWEGRPDTVDIFDLKLRTMPAVQLDFREVVEACFVAPAELRTMEMTGPAALYVRRRWPLSACDEHAGA